MLTYKACLTILNVIKLLLTGVGFMEIYIPDLYQKSIYNINYDLLISRGIKCILFDLDNTLVPVTVKKLIRS